jgi:hypothetical protein
MSAAKLSRRAAFVVLLALSLASWAIVGTAAWFAWQLFA